MEICEYVQLNERNPNMIHKADVRRVATKEFSQTEEKTQKSQVIPPKSIPATVQTQTQRNQKIQKVQDELDKVILTREELDDIKKTLEKILDASADDLSFFSRAAKIWGKLSLWKKIVAGIAFIIPLFAVGIIEHLLIFLGLSLATLFLYTSGSLLMDDHDNKKKAHITRLKAVVLNLTHTLGQIALSLDKLRSQLTVEIEKLSSYMDELQGQIQILTKQTEKLGFSVKEHEMLLKTNKAELDKIHRDFEEAQSRLSQKIQALEKIKTEMGAEIAKGKSISDSLKGTVLTLTNVISLDKEQKRAFEEKLNKFLENREASFHLIAERICVAEEQLAVVSKELELSNRRYQTLLDRGEVQVTRLEQLHTPEKKMIRKTPLQKSNPSPLQNIGFYGSTEKPTDAPLPNPTMQQTMEFWTEEKRCA
jgi:hypothetical protein